MHVLVYPCSPVVNHHYHIRIHVHRYYACKVYVRFATYLGMFFVFVIFILCIVFIQFNPYQTHELSTAKIIQ